MACECPVCYGDKTSCKLVCGHSFCNACVKAWYFKSEEPSCPMCRRKMYFEGMWKLTDEWIRERVDQKNQEFFGEAFEDIFEEESETESEADSDDSWETWSFDTQEESEADSDDSQEEPNSDWKSDEFYSRYMLAEIVQLQKDYKRAMELGVDFEWYMYNIEYFDVSYEPRVDIFDDIFPHEKNLFVSKYPHTLQNKRSGKRVPSECDTSYTVVFQIFV